MRDRVGSVAAHLARGLVGLLGGLGAVALFVAVPAGVARAVPEELAGPYEAAFVDAVDGDTLTVRVRIWLGQEVLTNVRIAGLDTPELRGACPAERDRAVAARAAVARLAAGGPLWLTDVRYDKYGGRVVARVADATGHDLGAALVSQGLGRPYGGGARGGWCG